MPRERVEWAMPEHLEPYRELVNNTGGNSLEDLMDTYYNEPNVLCTNLPRGVLAIAVASQVNLLQSLHARGLL